MRVHTCIASYLMRFSYIERKVHFCLILLARDILYVERSEYSKIAYYLKNQYCYLKRNML